MSTLSYTEKVYRARFISVLETMALIKPSLSVKIDIWRPKVVSPAEFADEGKEVWIRLGENVPAFFLEDEDRWFTIETGIFIQDDNNLMLPDGFDVRPDDHVIKDGVPWIVVRSKEQAGVCKVRIDRLKSRFEAPARTAPVYREIGLKARIV